jgi:imidazolonepropionase-like amidohydrolase
MLAIRGGTVVDVDGAREADVGVEDGRIVAVGDVGEADEELDATGQYVAPGLVDAHVHLSADARTDFESLREESHTLVAFRAARNLEAAVNAGVTTVRDVGSIGTIALDARRAVEEGVVAGPRVVPAGKNVVMTGGHGHWFGREADGPDEVRKAVREQLKAGAEVIKCMATGGVLTEGAVTGAPELAPDELEALVEAAAAKGVPTAAHCHGAEGIKNAVRAGIDSVEHGSFMDAEAAELMAEHDTHWVPTCSAVHGICDAPADAGIPEWAVEKGLEAQAAFDDAWDHALDGGVRIAMGTDAGTPRNHHGEIPREMAYMVDYGLDPERALAAATVESASLLGLDDVGRVAEGYVADLVVLEADPSTDASAWQSPEAVVARGDVV